MAKNKPIRSLDAVGSSQQETEKTTQDKFKLTETLANPPQVNKALHTGRLSPQISCTVEPEDKQMLNDITLFAINKSGKILNTSMIIRALIRLGHSKKDDLHF